MSGNNIVDSKSRDFYRDNSYLFLSKGINIASRFEVIDKLGKGGMGAVYKVKDIVENDLKALKLILPTLITTKEIKRLFINEVQIAQTLRHDNIVTVYEIHRDRENVLCFTMELLYGHNLYNYLKTNNDKLDFIEACNIVIQICHGLIYAHKKGIFHRDIKPQNIFILPDSKVKILDFGLAKAISLEQLTLSNEASGTIYYMSPEQLKGNEVDAKTDIFALGVVFYQMIMGEFPIGKFNLPSVIHEYIPPVIDSIIEKCINQNAQKRYGDVSVLVKDIENVKEEYQLKIDTLIEQGHLFIEQNQFQNTLVICENILKIAPNHKDAKKLLEATRTLIEKAKEGEQNSKKYNELTKWKLINTRYARRRVRRIYLNFIFPFAIGILLLIIVWLKAATVNLEYEIGSINRIRTDLLSENQLLDAKKEQLVSVKNITDRAKKQLGMIQINRGNIFLSKNTSETKKLFLESDNKPLSINVEPIEILLYSNDHMYIINEKGYILKEIKASNIPSLPLIKKLDFDKDKKALVESIKLISTIKRFTDSKSIEVHAMPYGLLLILNNEIIKIGYDNYIDKIARWKALEPVIRKKYLELEYVDLRFNNVTVKPKKENN